MHPSGKCSRKLLGDRLRILGGRYREDQGTVPLVQREIEKRAALRLGSDDVLQSPLCIRVCVKTQQVAAVTVFLVRDQAVCADRGYLGQSPLEAA
jgi:hypothetical protein